MGARGPKPTPTAILKARGSWRADANKNEPKPAKAMPDCPKWLDAEGRELWKNACELLSQMDVLTKVDGFALGRYCDAYVRWRKAAAFLQKYGDAYPLKDEQGNLRYMQPFPQVSIYANLSSLLSALEAQFGMTPSSRTRIVTTAGKPDETEQAKSRFFAGPRLATG